MSHSSGFVLCQGAALQIKWAAQRASHAEVENAVREQDCGVLEALASTCLDSGGKVSMCVYK